MEPEVIKVCANPICGDVTHNCPKKACYCANCGMRLMEINEKTYLKKFVRTPFQFDFKTGQRVYPEDLGYDPGYTEEEILNLKNAQGFFKSLSSN